MVVDRVRRRAGTAAFVAVLAVGGAPACSSSAVDGPKSALAMACDRWAATLGDRKILADDLLVSPGFPIHHDVDLRVLSADDRAAVLGAYDRACVAVAGLSGSTIDASFLDRCREALVARDLIATSLPVACIPPSGTRSDGDGCVADHQCASLHCAGAAAERCGRCAPAIPVGDPCDGDCGFGLSCFLSMVPGAHGGYAAACGVRELTENSDNACGSTVCSAGSYCARGREACVPLHVAGDACEEGFSCAAGLTCKNATCIAARAVGETCDVSVDCEIDAYCKPSNPPPGPGGPGVCTAASPIGQPCDDWYVECDRRSGTLCTTGCGTELVCTTLHPFDAPPAPPGAMATGEGCAISTGSTGACGRCPLPVPDGEACGPDRACMPRSACVEGTCRADSPICP